MLLLSKEKRTFHERLQTLYLVGQFQQVTMDGWRWHKEPACVNT